MRAYLISLCLLCIFSCKKNTKIVSSINLSQGKNIKNRDSSFQFKTIGISLIKSYDFPKEWSINTYEDSNIQLEKKDIEAQNKFEEIDYYNITSGSKIESINSNLTNFIKKDSLLSSAKIDSLFVVDSIILKNSKKILVLKSFATIDNDNFEYPIKIYKIDVVLFNKSTALNSINIYSEVDYPFSTKKNICYLDNKGKLYCKKFTIDEIKGYYDGFYYNDLNKIFNIKEK